ncbi:MAG TPA: oligosaccharide flippase family protein [Anaerolineales bacterium]|nr:oligosaccharide flippase family protein [Anaerolineales bacterium]
MSMPSNNTFTLKQRVLRSGSWTLSGYGVSQALRLGGNLILTRLLFPEAFGLMAIVQALIHGVTMLTDVGIGPSIVQKARGNDPDFLNTAWTVQIIRGFLIWGVLCALAWPMAEFYDQPLLVGMLPVVGLTAIISSFSSTKLFTAQRNLEAARITQIEVGTYALGLLCTVYLAWLQQSVWALVWGSLITNCLKMFASHVLLHGIRNQFAWDRDALDHLIGFGRWILLSSTLTFLSVEGARLLIGALLDMRQLALYTLASTMSLLLWQALLQVTGNVLFPVYSEVHRVNPKNLIAVLYKTRLTLILPSWGLAALFTFFGVEIMGVLYDPRYHDSGAMLELLAAGSFAGCVWGSYAGVLMAIGKVATHTLMTAIQIACQISGMLIGYYYGGGIGIVTGVAVANWMMYPVTAFIMYRNGFWQPKLDLIFLAASILVVSWAWHRVILNIGS